jgi:hypothetical protein
VPPRAVDAAGRAGDVVLGAVGQNFQFLRQVHSVPPPAAAEKGYKKYSPPQTPLQSSLLRAAFLFHLL